MQRFLALGLAVLATTASDLSFGEERPPVVTLNLASTFPGSMAILGDAAYQLESPN